jgi:hypothetical protein
LVVGLATGSGVAQSPPDRSQVPRTSDGHPDLQGVWVNNSVTPMTRPTQWKDKAELTEQELAELQKLVAQNLDQGADAVFADQFIQKALELKKTGKYDQTSYDVATGNYNNFWIAERDWDTRTSLIIDPPNGQFPPLTAAGQARRNAGSQRRLVTSEGGPAGRADGPEDRSLSERCISRGVPYTQAAYNSYFQIVQSPSQVVILQETIHDARVVPVGHAAPHHLPAGVRLWNGDSRGWWEGDTFVVETTNFREGFQGSTPGVKLTERYTRVSPGYINWAITVDDSATWTRPWTFMIRLKHTDDQLYEYACHEGNHSLAGILAGARVKESAAARTP